MSAVATTVTLNANDSNQVGSAQKVSILTAEPNIWLLIYSGQAEQNQYADGTSYWIFGQSTAETDAIVNVTLDNISGILLEYATTAGVSGFYEEDTWADWYVNSSSLNLRQNGDLILSASTTVIGGSPEAGFNSFNYYVSAKVILDAATISGTVRWVKKLTSPLTSPHFEITADTQVPGPSGIFPTSQVEASGVEGAVDSSDATYYYVPYTITGSLLGKTVSVSVDPVAASFGGVQPGGELIVEQISGPTEISLTTTNRHATNVDFEMLFQPNPQ